MRGFLQDLAFAARMSRKSPGFTLVVVLLLGLGIGANTAIFSALEALVLRSLPVRNPKELIRVMMARPVLGSRPYFDYAFFPILSEKSTKLENTVAIGDFNTSISDSANTERIRGQYVTPNYFSMLGRPAFHGRGIAQGDLQSVVLSHSLWTRRFHQEASVIGRRALIGGHPFQIVGVMPEGFNGTAIDTSPDIWVPVDAARVLQSDSPLAEYSVELVARLRPGATIEQARDETASLWLAYVEPKVAGRSQADRDFELNADIQLQSIANGSSALRPRFEGALKLLMGSVGLLLLMVCANVAGLLLARCAARQQELAVRVALGASAGRLVRQILSESLALASTGGAIGVAIAYLATPLLARSVPPIRHVDATTLPLAISIEPDARVILFSVGLCLLTAVLFGIGPALSAVRSDLQPSLATRGGTDRQRGRQLLIGIQAAACTLLLVGAGLLLGTFAHLRNIDPGFDARRIVTFSIDPEMASYTPEQAKLLQERLIHELRATPGIETVAIANRGLMRGTGLKMSVKPAGERITAADFMNSSSNAVSPDYFETMGMRVLAGRAYTAADKAGATPIPAIVNQTFVRRFFGSRDPIGQKFGYAPVGQPTKPTHEILGVVSDAKYRSIREPIQPTLYGLWQQDSKYVGSFIVHARTRGRPESVIQPAREVLRRIDPRLAFYEVNTLEEEVERSLWSERLVASLAGVFSLFATLLAAAGVYGLLAYLVERRRREFGIRIALGARSANIVELVARDVLTPVLLGVATGLISAALTAPRIQQLLYGIEPWDPRVLIGAAVVALGVTAIATALPSLRAIRVEPAAALRD